MVKVFSVRVSVCTEENEHLFEYVFVNACTMKLNRRKKQQQLYTLFEFQNEMETRRKKNRENENKPQALRSQLATFTNVAG